MSEAEVQGSGASQSTFITLIGLTSGLERVDHNEASIDLVTSSQVKLNVLPKPRYLCLYLRVIALIETWRIVSWNS